jgi:hypothetical protein
VWVLRISSYWLLLRANSVQPREYVSFKMAPVPDPNYTAARTLYWALAAPFVLNMYCWYFPCTTISTIAPHTSPRSTHSCLPSSWFNFSGHWLLSAVSLARPDLRGNRDRG